GGVQPSWGREQGETNSRLGGEDPFQRPRADDGRSGNPSPSTGSAGPLIPAENSDRKSTRLNSSHEWISYAVFCLKKKKRIKRRTDNTAAMLKRSSRTLALLGGGGARWGCDGGCTRVRSCCAGTVSSVYTASGRVS